jgi:hypothetical protein
MLDEQVFSEEYWASNELILDNDAIRKIKRGVYFINVETEQGLESAPMIKRWNRKTL